MDIKDINDFIRGAMNFLQFDTTDVFVEINGELWPIEKVVIRATGDWQLDDRPAQIVFVADTGPKPEAKQPEKVIKPYIPENVQAWAKHKPDPQEQHVI